MTGLQLAVLLGMVVGAGVALVIAGLVPRHPDLADVLVRFDSRTNTKQATAPLSGLPRTDRLGAWAGRRLPETVLRGVDSADLDILEVAPAHFYGQKLIGGLFGLAAVPLLALAWSLVMPVPVVASVGLTLLGGVAGFLAPNYLLRGQAREKRAEFTRALAAYADLIALGRLGSTGLSAAIPEAAEIATAWPFRRIARELRFAANRRLEPWVALEELSQRLRVPQLGEIAEVLRLGGVNSAQIAANLQAQAASLRTAVLHQDIDEANALSEGMDLPKVGLVIVLILLLITPSALKMLSQVMG